MPHILPFRAPVRLGDIPSLSPAELLALVDSLSSTDLQTVWDRYGIDDEAEGELPPCPCGCPDCDCKVAFRFAGPPVARRAWYLPMFLFLAPTVNLHERILRRLDQAAYAQAPEDPGYAATMPGSIERAGDYAARRGEGQLGDSAEARANGLLGYQVFGPRDLTPADLEDVAERLFLPVRRARNGSLVAGEVKVA